MYAFSFFFHLSIILCCNSHLLVAAISAVHLKWAGPASLWVEGRTKANVVSGCGADERRMGEAWQHVEGGGQHRRVSGYPQRALNRHLLVDLLPPRDLVIQPLCYQVLRTQRNMNDLHEI